MLSKRLDGRMGALSGDALKLVELARSKSEEIAGHYEKRDFGKALTEVRALADEANRYFDERAPWKLINTDPEATREVLSSVLNVFRLLAIYMKPVLPKYADRVAHLLNEKPYIWTDVARTLSQHTIGDYEHLAVRIEMPKIQQMIKESKVTDSKAATPVKAANAPRPP